MFCPGWPDTVRQINESGIRLLTPPLCASRRAARFQTFVADGLTGGWGFSPDPPKRRFTLSRIR